MEDLKSKILQDIEKTGFVTELKVSTILMDNMWNAVHGATYEDQDNNVSREIDIVASKVHSSLKLGFRLTIELVIEVKKSERPWIIFTSNSGGVTPVLGWRVINRTFNAKKWIPGTERIAGRFDSIFSMDALLNNTIREGQLRVGKAFHELGKAPNDKSKIYEALITACKASVYKRNKNIFDEQLSDFDPERTTDLVFYLPVVVVAGGLYEVYNDFITDKIIVNEKGYIPVQLGYSSPNYKVDDFNGSFYPDVVSFEKLSDYLTKVESWRQTMITTFTKELEQLNKKPDKLFMTPEMIEFIERQSEQNGN